MKSIFLRNISLEGRQVDIAIWDGTISSIEEHKAGGNAPADAEVVDCEGKAAVPGFVNAHTHAAMSLMRGIGEDMVLEDWLNHIWTIESRLDNPFVYNGTRVAALEMIRTGTTAFNDMYWFAPMAHKAAVESGLASMVSFTFLDNFDPGAAERQKDEFLRFAQSLPYSGARNRAAVSIHSVYTVSEQLIVWATEYARSHGMRIHIHLSETEKEVIDCKAAHGGLSPTEYLDALGVLGPDVIAAHCLWLSDNDVEILGKRGVNCVHNVNSNLKLSSGLRFLWKELSDAGANVCLGTDGCASSNNLDMLEVMKTTAIVQKAWRGDPTVLPLQTLLDMATINGAKALGLNSGRVAVGMDADIQIVDTSSSFFLSPGPFLANFIYSAHSDCISSLISGGKFVMRDRIVEREREILSGGKSVLNILETK